MTTSFQIDQKQFLALLSSCLPICSKRTSVESTALLLLNVRHRELMIKCTDLEVSLQMSHELEAVQTEQPATVLVSCKRIHDIVKELEGTLTITITTGTLTLASPHGTITLHTVDASNFPSFPDRIENLMELSAERFLEMLKAVAFVIPAQHANSTLTGLLWESGPAGLRMTATDGHCLAHVSTSESALSEARSWVVPRRAVAELQKIVELMRERTIFIGTCGKQLVISGESFNFFTKLLAGTFPNYTQVLERSEFRPATVQRGQLLKTLRRAATLLSGQFIAAQFSFTPARLAISLHNKEVGNLQEEVALVGFDGAPCDVRFYAPYLIQGLSVFDEEVVTLYIQNALKPILVTADRPSGVTQLYLVMPVASPTAP